MDEDSMLCLLRHANKHAHSKRFNEGCIIVELKRKGKSNYGTRNIYMVIYGTIFRHS